MYYLEFLQTSPITQSVIGEKSGGNEVAWWCLGRFGEVLCSTHGMDTIIVRTWAPNFSYSESINYRRFTEQATLGDVIKDRLFPYLYSEFPPRSRWTILYCRFKMGWYSIPCTLWTVWTDCNCSTSSWRNYIERKEVTTNRVLNIKRMLSTCQRYRPLLAFSTLTVFFH